MFLDLDLPFDINIVQQVKGQKLSYRIKNKLLNQGE